MIYVDGGFNRFVLDKISDEVISEGIVSIIGVVDFVFGDGMDREYFDFGFILNSNKGRFSVLGDNGNMFVFGVFFG